MSERVVRKISKSMNDRLCSGCWNGLCGLGGSFGYLNSQNQMGCIHLHGLVYGYEFISHSSGYYHW